MEVLNYVELQLQEKSLNTGQSILMGQWVFDKTNIPNALKAIAGFFPHYSLHDETHSESIINNIVKMLGCEVIKSLSCTDLWLLLECAYCHDLGMVVTANRIDKAFSDGGFIKHFMKIFADKDHPCYNYAQHFEIKEGKLYQKSEPLKIDVIDSIRFLLADYFRKEHADNSQKTIENPISEAGIDSPRSIIPKRLYTMLGRICRAHGQKFDYVMNLPKAEDGIGLEECHPRFIACLLRIGDLLDIDNNRFSEALIKTVNDLPSDSKLHKDKHKSISHLSINTRCIEIEAECHSPKVAQVTQDWFDWIGDEFKTQTLKWNSIVPEGLNCYLPTLNYLRIKIEGYLTVNTSNKPKFTIDTSKALELLQGKSFYKDIFEAIREILQNAVDSTLLRIYLDSRKEGLSFSGVSNEFLEFASNYHIKVKLRTTNSGEYIVTISDQGLGLKPEHLTYLINTGSSSKNVEKKIIVEEMPEWMRPSGVFGIGFQSIFLLTDKVEIITKEYDDDRKMHIELYSPNSPMKGDVYMKEVKGSYEKGLTIQFTIKQNVNLRKEKDFFDSVPHDVERTFVEDRIRNYAATSFVPIWLYVEEKAVEKIPRRDFCYYDPMTKVELGFADNITDFNANSGTSYYYRNATVSGNGTETKFMAPLVNVHSGSALEMLTIDRSSFRREIDLSSLVSDAIVNFVNSEAFDKYIVQCGNQATNVLIKLAGYLEYTNRIGNLTRNFANLYNMQSFTLNAFGLQNKTIRDITNYKRIRFRTISNNALSFQEISSDEMLIEANSLPLGLPSFFSDMVRLILKQTYDSHKCCYCTSTFAMHFFAGAEYVMTDEFNESEINLTMANIKSEISRADGRCYVSYLPGYDAIRIPTKLKDIFPLVNTTNSLFSNFNEERILSPFVRINNEIYDCRNDKFYEYVHSINHSDIDTIKAAYDRFVEEAKQVGLVVTSR